MSDIKSIGIMGYENCSEQDTVTPLAVFKGAAMELKAKGQNLDVKLVAIEPGNVKMQFGTEVVPDAVLSKDDLFDLLLVPGGVGSGAMTLNDTMLQTIQRHYEAGKVVSSNCSGAGILFRSGILGDHPITCVAAIEKRLRELGANVPQPRRMWIGLPEARLWTTTGSAGVHGSSVAMVCHYFGRDVGQSVSMMFDTLSAYGQYIYELEGPEFYFHPTLEAEFQGIWEAKLLPEPSAK